MKARISLPLLAAGLLLTTATSFAKATPKPTDDRPKLAVVVVGYLSGTGYLSESHGSAINDFDRLEMALQRVAEQRKWPVALEAELIESNTPAHEIELRIFLQSVREKFRGDLTFRSWVTLSVKNTRYDFGIVTLSYDMIAGEDMERALTKIFRGAAAVIADKVEPILFPKPAKAKP